MVAMSNDHGYLTRKYMCLLNYLDAPMVLEDPYLTLIEYYEFECLTVGSMADDTTTLHHFHFNLEDFQLLEALDIIDILVDRDRFMIRKNRDAIGKVMWNIEKKYIVR